ncbi:MULTISPECIES: ABC transporter ATP-binding protein [unclassified Acidisoma]|uniref:ABC transporter ATP-binding protein n=1 Tax=unclassified Acidisoma TaxID=2634065 RepID=UPI00131B3C18|nr:MULTISPECIES: ABC transporter ATP-binding protein [unclassified Acidisoma]
MTRPLLEVRDLCVDFAGETGVVAAVAGVSFSVSRGETLVIVGESGSGKSVTSLAIMGLIPKPPGRISSGEILFHARGGGTHNLTRADARTMQQLRGAEIAMIFQEPMSALNPVYTIGDQIIETLRLHEPLSRRAARVRAIEMLALLGVPDPARRVDAYPHELSGGLRQRAMIAMALSCNPSLLIADEPTTALDVTVQAQILELISKLQRQLSMGVIFITHNLGVAAEIADRILVMYAGQTVEAAPARAIFEDTRMPYTRGLLNSIPRLGMDRDAGPLPTIPGIVPNLSEMPAGCAFHPRCAHARPEPCTVRRPDLEQVGDQHVVRCARWREIAREMS